MFLPQPTHTLLLQSLAHLAHSLVHMHQYMICLAVPHYELSAKGQPYLM